MNKLCLEQQEQLFLISFNNIEKHNAFDDELLKQLDSALDQALSHSDIRVIVIQANGKHFSAGADLNWMQRMAHASESDNHADALKFAQTLHKLSTSTKPTVALVQGTTYGGGLGIMAACDVVFATEQAKFCFSELNLGLIPAVISPYVIQAIGARMAKALFLSAEVFNAPQAQAMHLIHRIVPASELRSSAYQFANNLAQKPEQALYAAKALVTHVQDQPINDDLIQDCAAWIAKIRVSKEAQNALHLFLHNKTG